MKGEETLSGLLDKARYYKCKVKHTDDHVTISCPPGYGLQFKTYPTALHTVFDVVASHITPYRLNPRLKEAPLAARDFLDRYPGCEYMKLHSFPGERVSILDYSCGGMPVYEAAEMMEWLINHSRYAAKVARGK